MSRDNPNGYATPITHTPLLPRKEMSRSCSSESSGGKLHVQVLHPTHNMRVLKNKKRVIKMLCVVVSEYFICWTPLFVLNSWTTLDYLTARKHFTPLLKTSILLCAYMSSCIHPITYCFMNQRFRQSFADAFRCCFRKKANNTTAIFSDASHANSQERQGGPLVARRINKNNQVTITWNRSR